MAEEQTNGIEEGLSIVEQKRIPYALTGHKHTGVGDDEAKLDLVDIENKEFFVPVTANNGQAFPYTSVLGTVWVYDGLTSGQSNYFVFSIPENFRSLQKLQVVIIPDASETIQFDARASYAAPGEDQEAHTGTITNSTQAVTSDKLAELDISSLLEDVGAGDYVGLQFTSNTSSLRVIGLKVKYS